MGCSLIGLRRNVIKTVTALLVGVFIRLLIMDEWKCIKVPPFYSYWTLGKIYITNENGNLTDDDGDERLSPQLYNELSKYLRFEPIPVSLDNE